MSVCSYLFYYICKEKPLDHRLIMGVCSIECCIKYDQKGVKRGHSTNIYQYVSVAKTNKEPNVGGQRQSAFSGHKKVLPLGVL